MFSVTSINILCDVWSGDVSVLSDVLSNNTDVLKCDVLSGDVNVPSKFLYADFNVPSDVLSNTGQYSS